MNLVPILIKIQQQFKKRFTDFDTLMKNELIIFNNPKGCKIEDQEIYYRVELCNLQADPFVLARNEYALLNKFIDRESKLNCYRRTGSVIFTQLLF